MAVLAHGVSPRSGRWTSLSRRPALLGLMALLGALVACSDAPDVREPLARELPPGWQIDSFKVEAEESVGTKVEPEYHSRFRASASPREDLFLPVATLLDTSVLRTAQRKGEMADLYGISRSRLIAGTWQTHFEMQRSLPAPSGRPASSFAQQQVVVGTPAFQQFMATAAERLDAAQRELATQAQGLAAQRTALGEFERQGNELVRQSRDARDREVRRLQSERQGILKAQSQAVQALSRHLNAAEQEQLAVPRRERNETVAELEKRWRLRHAELNAQRLQLDQQRSRDYTDLQRAQASEAASAARRLDRAQLLVWRAEAAEKGREARKAVDAGQAPRRAELDAEQKADAARHHERLAEVNQTWTTRNEEIRRTIAAERTEGQQKIQAADKDAIAALDVAMASAATKQQEAAAAQQALISERRSQVQAESNRIQREKVRLSGEHRVLSGLERDTGQPSSAGQGGVPGGVPRGMPGGMPGVDGPQPARGAPGAVVKPVT